MDTPETTQKQDKILGIKGMHDILPEDASLWEHFENTAQSVLKSYGYQRICTPIIEATALFSRGLGNVTDIVEKEMYSFTDNMNGDQLTLRPEGTAGVVRAVIEHNLTYDSPKRLWYSGQMFRHERPQRGRYRQFHQFGAEAIGFIGPDIDAELILLCQRLWDDLDLQGIGLEINSIGEPEERSRHRTDLIHYFEQHYDRLDSDAKHRLHHNPLRILDSKNPDMQALINDAPKLLAYLESPSIDHFESIQKILRYNNIPFVINPRLVRGMDYYNRTVFEWVTNDLGAQGTICGGGRYDRLIDRLGGKPTTACGFAIGMERVLYLMHMQIQQTTRQWHSTPPCDVYMLHQGDTAELHTFLLAERLRCAGLNVIQHCTNQTGAKSFKSQMKRADVSGAYYAILIGEDEATQGVATVKPLRQSLSQSAEERGKPAQYTWTLDVVVEKLLEHFNT